MAFEFKDIAAVMRVTLSFPPAIIGWNRLEGIPRTARFDRALRAEVRDALWFLTRQWQFGEFRGEDAGSPVEVRTAVRVDPIQHYARAGQPAVAYDPALPLEAHAEHEPVTFDLTLHAELTRYFFRLIPRRAALQASYLREYPLSATSVSGFADDDTRRALQLASSRVLDVGALLAEVENGKHAGRVDGGSIAVLPTEGTAVKQAGRDLATWFLAQYSQPNDPADNAWDARFLEYRFAVATETADRGQSVLLADQYAQGHLDWFAFDVAAPGHAPLVRGAPPAATPTPPAVKPLSFIPVPVSFGGMPSHRYWEMENRQIEFADIDAHTTDVAKLLLTEFVLVYANDWCVIPYELPVGSVSEVTGMLVCDDFGEQSLLLPAGRGFDDRWQRWSMFTLSRSPAGGEADTRFFLPPAVAKLLEAQPLEKVHFLRDEMANMAWAVERIVPSGMGVGLSGYSVGAAAPPVILPPHPTAPVRYVLGTDVPNNWIPFIPVHVPGSNRSVQHQRARMPGPERELRTSILKEPAPYYINEEEIPRAGKVVTRSFQRARWLNGLTTTWIGRRVLTSRGEGSSGLAFDQVVDTAKR